VAKTSKKATAVLAGATTASQVIVAKEKRELLRSREDLRRLRWLLATRKRLQTHEKPSEAHEKAQKSMEPKNMGNELALETDVHAHITIKMKPWGEGDESKGEEE